MFFALKLAYNIQRFDAKLSKKHYKKLYFKVTFEKFKYWVATDMRHKWAEIMFWPHPHLDTSLSTQVPVSGKFRKISIK